LVLPDVPQEVGYLWDWWLEAKRNAEPMMWAELKAWAEMTATPINARDAKALMSIDDAVLRSTRNDHANGPTGN